MVARVLCVAEKPAIARAVANHLSGGQINTHNIRGNQYVKNYEFDFTFGPPWGSCAVVMTSVLGHLTGLEFDAQYRSWHGCRPDDLFEARVQENVAKDKVSIAQNITQQARYAQILFIWTDCDREGEHIGAEVRTAARQGNERIEVKRARFSNTERAHVMHAALHPIELDERQVQAVSARIEIDLRLGASLTRFQTLTLQNTSNVFDGKVISYGSCQFPTLGFVVERYLRVQNFVPEVFWTIKLIVKHEEASVTFLWDRTRLFDRAITTILFERCLTARNARITDVKTKPTKKWRPLPLTTVELQRLGSMYLRLNSQQVMKIAEDLYTKGFISYPRTETDQFDRGIDLRRLVQKQTQDRNWGPYAQGLLDGALTMPRSGSHNDQAHPPIHPVTYVAAGALSPADHQVYTFITRRFLACCSADAVGSQTTVNLAYGPETFHASGLRVLQRNYLDVYPYEKWESSMELPGFERGQTVNIHEARIDEGATTAPGYLTEPELISLMDRNGIGTDATMAEHIAKIKEREYVMTRPRGRAGVSSDEHEHSSSGRGGRGGRGARGRGRGGRGGAGARTTQGQGQGGAGVQEFIPTTLGCALINAYDALDLTSTPSPAALAAQPGSGRPGTERPGTERPSSGGGGHGTEVEAASQTGISLSKPFLRREMEARMRDVCDGRRAKDEVVRQVLAQYRGVYARVQRDVELWKATVRRMVVVADQPATA